MVFKTYKLCELATICYGKNQSQVVCEKSEYPIYGTGGLMGYATRPLYSKPSVLIGRKGTIGKVKFVEHPFWTVDTLFYTIVNEEIIAPRFLYYVMSQIDLNTYNEGTTIPSLRTETLNRLELEIPCLDEQRQILAILQTIDYTINSLQKVNQNLQKLIFTHFDHIFSETNADNCSLSDMAFVNPQRNLPKKTVARCIDMSQLSTTCSTPNGWEYKPYNGGMKFKNGDTLLLGLLRFSFLGASLLRPNNHILYRTVRVFS